MVIDERKLVTRVESTMPHPLFGDTAMLCEFLDYYNNQGGQFPQRIRQSQGGSPVLDLTVTGVSRQEPVDMAVPDDVRTAIENVAVQPVAPGIWFLVGGSHNSVAVEPRNGSWTRPARVTTLRAHAREEEQRSQRAAARLNRVRSALTQPAKVAAADCKDQLKGAGCCAGVGDERGKGRLNFLAATTTLTIPADARRERRFEIGCAVTVGVPEDAVAPWLEVTVQANTTLQWRRRADAHNPGAWDGLDYRFQHSVPVGQALRVTVSVRGQGVRRRSLNIAAEEG